MSSPKAPKPTAAQLEQESAQAQATALLDQQENERRKRLLNAAAGMRAFSGSALGRAVPGNTVAGAPSASQVAAAGGSLGSGSIFAPSAGGGGGGIRASMNKA